jgi:ribose transport system substrate-binding protein
LKLSPEDAWNAAVIFDDEITNRGSAENAGAKLKVVGQGWGNWNRTGGLQVAEDLITANKNLNLMMGENDDMLIGARQALINAELKGVDIIAAADGAQDAYDLIKDPSSGYIATGENSPIKVGLAAVEIAKGLILDGKKWTDYPKVTLTPAYAVTIENVDEHYDYGF